MPHQREIFIIEVEFEDIDGYKDRPVLILFQCDHLYTIVPITHVAPKNPPRNYFDEAKELIVNWKKYGLDRQSWVKCANTKNYDGSIFVGKQPVGIMDIDEFDKITEKICYYL